MESRINGTLKTWNSDKGFGFITPLNGGQDIFVHISDYPKPGGLPTVGEPLSFEIILNKDGKKKAVLVQRPGGKPSASKAGGRRQSIPDRKSSWVDLVITLVLVVMIGAAGYTFLVPKFNSFSLRADTPEITQPVATSSNFEMKVAVRADTPEPTQPVATPPAITAPSRFQCDGRTHCSQMSSCAEATYFIRNCPNTQMDGDGDGVPCESQWCTSPFAK
jgi:cold shock CspA family protein